LHVVHVLEPVVGDAWQALACLWRHGHKRRRSRWKRRRAAVHAPAHTWRQRPGSKALDPFHQADDSSQDIHAHPHACFHPRLEHLCQPHWRRIETPHGPHHESSSSSSSWRRRDIDPPWHPPQGLSPARHRQSIFDANFDAATATA
ncbi:unnamed protein product, partial [Aphanomyces euteiches]